MLLPRRALVNTATYSYTAGMHAAQRPALAAAFLVLLLLLACGGSAPPPSTAPPAAPAVNPLARPIQRALAKPEQFTLTADGVAYTVNKLAAYATAGVVVSLENYYVDAGAKIAPCDIAMAFDKLAAGDLWRKITWSQHDRWYWWTYQHADIPGGNAFIVANSANNHIIPANNTVKLAARALEIGDQVELKGWLVKLEQASDPNVFHWQSSLSREDTGDGSCELLYLEEIRRGSSVWH